MNLKKGTRVRIKIGHPFYTTKNGKLIRTDMRPDLVGKIATIQYSYYERYGGNKFQMSQYCLKFRKLGTMAWFSTNQFDVL